MRSCMRPRHARAGCAVMQVVVALGVAGCGDSAGLPLSAGFGPTPTLPEPNPTLIPTIDIAPAIGWPPGVTPMAAEGTRVAAFASGLNHPRWLYVLPNGDILVAETGGPERPASDAGLRGYLTGFVM